MSKRNQGIMLAIIGTMFWGISSPFAQALSIGKQVFFCYKKL